jgi:hypothetical protein
MVGEIGGAEEEKAAAFIEKELTKPVIAYIAGFTAPPGKTMGHAGAIISGTAGTAQAKKEALEAHGVQVGTNPTEVARLVAERAGIRARPPPAFDYLTRHASEEVRAGVSAAPARSQEPGRRIG